MLDLSRVSREALDVVVQWFLRQYPQHPVTGRIRAEAAAPEAEPVLPCPERGGQHAWDMKDPCRCILCGEPYAGKYSEPPQPPLRPRADAVRYELRNTSTNPWEPWNELVRDPDGEWVRYEDAFPTPAESPAIAAAERAVLDAAVAWVLKQNSLTETDLWLASNTLRDRTAARRAAARGTEDT